MNISLHESIFFELVAILNIYFYILNILIPLVVLHPKIVPQDMTDVHNENVAFLNLSLTTLLLQLLLHNMQSPIWKLTGQYDYPKFVCHQSINTESLYMEY